MKKNRKKTASISVTTKDETAGKGKIKHLWIIAFLCISVLLVYLPSLKGTWALDDSAIGQSASVENILDLRLGYRKIAFISFLLNRWINPLDPVNYRVMNIIIHSVNSVLVYLIAFLTLRLPGWKEKYGDYSLPVALISSVVFALHPININAVAYIVQRMASLAAMFVLLSLLSYMFARVSTSGIKATVFYILTIIFMILGIFSKENAVMAIPLILLYDYVFLVRHGRDRFSKKLITGISIGLITFGTSAMILGFHKTISDVFGTFAKFNQPIQQHGWTAVDVYWTPVQHILTEFRVIGRYIFLVLMPVPKFLVFDWWGFSISNGLTDPMSTIVSMIIIAGVLSFSLFKIRKLPFLSFGILWYFIALSLESFIAVGSDLYFEHRNYLPVAGLFIGITAQIMTFFKEEVFKGKFVLSIVILLSVILSSLTFYRNLVWKDSITLWKDTVDKAPENLRAVIALGNAYLRLSDLSSARNYYENAVKVSASAVRPEMFHNASYSLGMLYLFEGDLEKAKKVIDLMDEKIEGSYAIGIIKGFYSSLEGDQDGAIEKYNNVLPKASSLDRVIVYTLLGDAYRKKEFPEKALESYKTAVEIDPSFSAAYYGIGVANLSMRNPGEAISNFEKTLALDPNNVLALADMADILLIKKEPPEKIIPYAERAVSKNPPFYQPYLTMANILIVMGKEEDAEGFYRKAKEHGVKDYMIVFSKARSYYMKGDGKKAEIFLKELALMKNIPEKIRNAANNSLK